CDIFFQRTEVGAEIVIPDDTQTAIFEITSESEGEFFFYGRSEGDRLDLPAESFPGLLGQLHSHAGGVDARAFDLGEFEQAVEFEFDFGKGFVLKFDPAAVPHDIADLFADVDDAEIVFPRDINTDVELRET